MLPRLKASRKFREELLDYDLEYLRSKEGLLKYIRNNYFSDADFTYERVSHASVAVAKLFRWCGKVTKKATAADEEPADKPAEVPEAPVELPTEKPAEPAIDPEDAARRISGWFR